VLCSSNEYVSKLHEDNGRDEAGFAGHKEGEKLYQRQGRRGQSKLYERRRGEWKYRWDVSEVEKGVPQFLGVGWICEKRGM
jgi:hypothetical protein